MCFILLQNPDSSWYCNHHNYYCVFAMSMNVIDTELSNLVWSKEMYAGGQNCSSRAYWALGPDPALFQSFPELCRPLPTRHQLCSLLLVKTKSLHSLCQISSGQNKQRSSLKCCHWTRDLPSSASYFHSMSLFTSCLYPAATVCLLYFMLFYLLGLFFFCYCFSLSNFWISDVNGKHT